jgi:hypothetical protein
VVNVPFINGTRFHASNLKPTFFNLKVYDTDSFLNIETAIIDCGDRNQANTIITENQISILLV